MLGNLPLMGGSIPAPGQHELREATFDPVAAAQASLASVPAPTLPGMTEQDLAQLEQQRQERIAIQTQYGQIAERLANPQPV